MFHIWNLMLFEGQHIFIFWHNWTSF